VDAVDLPGVDLIVEEQDKEDPAPPSVEMYDLNRSDDDPPLVETNQVRNNLPAPEEPTPAPTAAQAEPQATRIWDEIKRNEPGSTTSPSSEPAT
jgi:hypothetical protein